MTIGILEYDKEIAYQLTEVISENCPHIQVKVWERDSSLKEDISNGSLYKILFLSLEKDPMDIIEYSRRLQDLHPDVKIIYTTELNNSVFEVFHSTPTYVLSRPLNIGHVKKALAKCVPCSQYWRTK